MKALKLKTIGFQVPDELDKWLQELAQKEFCSKSAIARKILMGQLQKAAKKEGK